MTDNDTILNGLAPIWMKLLGVKTIQSDDNFFAIGGHSLMAIKLIAEVQRKLDIGAEVTLPDLFENPTLAGFSARLKSLKAGGEEL